MLTSGAPTSPCCHLHHQSPQRPLYLTRAVCHRDSSTGQCLTHSRLSTLNKCGQNRPPSVDRGVSLCEHGLVSSLWDSVLWSVQQGSWASWLVRPFPADSLWLLKAFDHLSKSKVFHLSSKDPSQAALHSDYVTRITVTIYWLLTLYTRNHTQHFSPMVSFLSFHHLWSRYNNHLHFTDKGTEA